MEKVDFNGFIQTPLTTQTGSKNQINTPFELPNYSSIGTSDSGENMLQSTLTKSEITRTEESAKTLTDACKTLKQNIQNKTTVLDNANKTVQTCLEKLNSAQDKLNEAKFSKDEKDQSQISALQKEYDSAKKSYDNAIKKQKTASEELEKLKKESDQKNKELTETNKKITELKQELDKELEKEEKQKLEAAQKQIAEAKAKLNENANKAQTALNQSSKDQKAAQQFSVDGILPVQVPQVGSETNPFETGTDNLLYKKQEPNAVLNAAQKYLGYQEVTKTEYDKLSDEEKQKTQMGLIGKNGTLDQQWCAHSVSKVLSDAGVDDWGHISSVQQYKDKATKDGSFKGIKTNTVTAENYLQERSLREPQIAQQLKEMSPGDLILWKTDYAAKAQDGTVDVRKSSHIGFIEEVTPDNKVVVLEGNANEFVEGAGTERYIAINTDETIRGDQEINDYQEVNMRDGFIRKTYTIENLAAYGYAGYIDMQDKIK